MTEHRAARGSASAIDPRTAALLRLAVLVALGAPPRSYTHEAAELRSAGADAGDVIATLAVVSPSVGLARAVAAAPGLAAAIGYDLDEALEGVDEPADDLTGDRSAGGRGRPPPSA